METKTITKVGMAALIAMLQSAKTDTEVLAALESETMCEIAQRDIAGINEFKLS